MKKSSIQSFPAFLVLLFLLILNGCGPDVSEQVQPTQIPPQCQEDKAEPEAIKEPPLADPEITADPDILRVGISLDSPPFIYKKDNKIQGIEADLAEQLATFINKKVEFVKVPDKRAAEALLKNHVDILMSGRKIARNFKCPVEFSEPYLRSGQILLVRNHEAPLFSSGIYNLENSGYTFGVVVNSAGDQFLTKSIRGIRIMRFRTLKAATQALTRKKIDLILHDAPMICAYAADNKAASLTPILTLLTEEFIGWEMRKEDEELRKEANRFIRQAKADGRLQKTIKQWIPTL
jgi:ABC-type amino acid transport substrate-binding protein